MTQELQVTVYTPESPLREPAKLIRSLFTDLARSRELAWRLFVRDTSSSYRQSVFGYLWAFAGPVVTTATFVFLSSQGIINVGQTVIPYAAFVMVGTLLWQSFTDALNSPLRATLSARSMLTKINFPREALILAGLAEVVLNTLIRTVLLIPIFIAFHVPFTATFVLGLLATSGLILIGLSLGLLITPIGVLYGDVGRSVSLIAGFWMLLTPVVYPTPRTGIAAVIARWNPVSPVFVAARDMVIGQQPQHLGSAAAVLACALVLLFFGWILFRLGMPILIERMGG